MVDTLQQKRFEDRSSQKLGVSDYLKGAVLWGALPFIAAAAAVTFGKVTKYKIFPLDGSPSLIQHAYEKLFKKVATDIAHPDQAKVFVAEAIDHWDRFGLHRNYGMEEGLAKTVTKDAWNFLKTLEVSAIPTIYHFWKHSERQRISMTPIHDRLEKLQELKPTDAELRDENASLRQQLEYVQQHADHKSQHAKPTLQVQSSEHHGHASERAQALQV